MFEDEDDSIEFDRTCQNYSFFYQDSEDLDYGICMNNDIYEPYIDEIIESDNFSCCHELYIQNYVQASMLKKD